MDIKLAKYASSQEPGAVSADFLELLMFGEPSEPLELFLTRDLTEKGLKKLDNSFNISYSTIQKLVVEPLHSGILNICYHLNTVKGMSRNVYFYKVTSHNGQMIKYFDDEIFVLLANFGCIVEQSSAECWCISDQSYGTAASNRTIDKRLQNILDLVEQRHYAIDG